MSHVSFRGGRPPGLPCPIRQAWRPAATFRLQSTTHPSVPPRRPAVPAPPSVARVVAASFVGTAIEWYDFFLYGTAAALVFPRLFFPEADPLAGQMAAFGTYAVGFVARPVGGVLFGHYGDRFGRKAALVATLVLVGLSTCAMGLLPTYEVAGAWAPVLLVALRFVQGLGVGGEWAGAVLLVVEHGGSR